jgi:trans-aconitate 2-methyltransferase
MRWDPGQYMAFADHRARPAVDLLGRVPVERPARVYDLGCGTGNITRLLCARWPEAEVVGVDLSEDMLAKARETAPAARFETGDLAAWSPAAPPDVIYSNAALHWIDAHDRLFPRLFAALAPGGALAVQMPRNFQAPSHVMMRQLAATGRWAAKLHGALPDDPVAPPQHYYDLLAPLAARLDIWEVEYLQVLEGDDPVLSWVRGTALRPALARLDAAEAAAFEATYAAGLRDAYPRRPDGRTLFPFRRLFIVAQRAA